MIACGLGGDPSREAVHRDLEAGVLVAENAEHVGKERVSGGANDLWLGEHGVAATIGAATGVDAATVREQAIASTPTGRFTSPEQVATLVALLASPRTGNVTGSNYVIDGA